MKFSVIVLTYNQLPFLKERVLPAWEVQTFDDFELVFANDGSTDGTKEYLDELRLKHYSKKKNTGFDLVGNLNKAAEICKGEYLVWVMGDTYPREDFLERLLEAVKPDRMVNGNRIVVDEEGKKLGRDWRVNRVMERKLFALDKDILEVKISKPWELMTLNSMCMPKAMWDEMGGIYSGYKGYGQMDSDMAAWAYHKGYGLFWNLEAIVYHLFHDDRPDSKENQDLLHKRLKEFQK